MTRDLGESRNVGPVSAVIGLFVLLAIYLAFHLPSGAPTRSIGIVQSAGAISVAKIQGGTRESSLVLLPNGDLVVASVVSGGPLVPGDKVRVLEQRAILGAAAYQVVAKEPGQ